MKRLLDILVATTALLLLSPFILLVALSVWFWIGAPVLFVQRRPGLGGQPFSMYKFRSMSGERDGHGRQLSEVERLTRFGRFLRSTSLDELPELWNVLRGDMSMVGPRPLLMEYLSLYSVRQARRHEVRPGVTGWAQVNGRNSISWDERFELDVWYVENQSMLLDLRILCRTLGKVVTREGISRDRDVAMPRFTGSRK